jgi:hypothetical protein
MAITPNFKRFEMYRPGRIHFLTATSHYVCTQAWIDNDPEDGTQELAGGTNPGDNVRMVLQNPISYIKSIANEAAHAATGDAFFDLRPTIIVGTLDESIVGAGWEKLTGGTGTTIKDCWYKKIYMDEADHFDGNFDYVELENDAAECSVVCYEYNY